MKETTRRPHSHLTDEQLRSRLAELEERACDTRGSVRVFTWNLIGEYEEELHIRAVDEREKGAT